MKKSVFIIMVLVSLLAIPYYYHQYFCRLLVSSAFAAQTMKIAVAATDKTPAAAVSDQAASAPYFLLFDRKGKLLEALENPYKNADSAGPSVVNYLAGKGATVIVGGGFGPKIVEVDEGQGYYRSLFQGQCPGCGKQSFAVQIDQTGGNVDEEVSLSRTGCSVSDIWPGLCRTERKDLRCNTGKEPGGRGER